MNLSWYMLTIAALTEDFSPTELKRDSQIIMATVHMSAVLPERGGQPTAVDSSWATAGSSHIMTASINMSHWLPVGLVLPATHLRISSCSLPTEFLQSVSMVGTAVAILKPLARDCHLTAGKRALCSSKTTELTSKSRHRTKPAAILNIYE